MQDTSTGMPVRYLGYGLNTRAIGSGRMEVTVAYPISYLNLEVPVGYQLIPDLPLGYLVSSAVIHLDKEYPTGLKSNW